MTPLRWLTRGWWRSLPRVLRRRWFAQCVGGPLCGEWLPNCEIGYYALYDDERPYVAVPPTGSWSVVMDRYVRLGSRFHFKESVYMTRSRLDVEA